MLLLSDHSSSLKSLYQNSAHIINRYKSLGVPTIRTKVLNLFDMAEHPCFKKRIHKRVYVLCRYHVGCVVVVHGKFGQLKARDIDKRTTLVLIRAKNGFGFILLMLTNF